MTTHDTWKGGTAVQAQVDTQTVALTWAAGDTIDTTLTDENGTATTVQTTIVGSTIENVVDEHLADLQASTNRLFAAITWSKSGTTQIVATATTAGVPFYISVAYVTAGDGTYVTASTTANAGPNDWNTTGNWQSGAVPVAEDIVNFAPHPDTGVSHPVLYGLNQNAIDLDGFTKSASFKANIGDSINGFYLRIDVSNATGNIPRTFIRSSVGDVWLWGTHDEMYIAETSRSKDAVHLKGTVTTLRVNESGVQGTITAADSMTVTTLHMNGCPGAKVNIGSSVTMTTANITAGSLKLENSYTTLNMAGSAVVETVGTGTAATINVRGGQLFYNGSGTITTLNLSAGVVDFRATKASVTAVSPLTVTTANVEGGHLNDRGATRAVVYFNPINYDGGQVSTDYGQTITPTQ
jgi:hypothetical protein